MPKQGKAFISTHKHITHAVTRFALEPEAALNGIITHCWLTFSCNGTTREGENTDITCPDCLDALKNRRNP